jgi:hypothetical protein
MTVSNRWNFCKPRRKLKLFSLVSYIVLLFLPTTFIYAELTGSNVLVLVNENSPASIYIAKLYRQYHPSIEPQQVLYLTGLKDCAGPQSTPADEIISRDDYKNKIAQPVRYHLLTSGLLAQVRLIVTTAGLPYRIEDTVYPEVVYPNGSNPYSVSSQETIVDAASVESELACLWYSDWWFNPFGIKNRIINPWQGSRSSSIVRFAMKFPWQKQLNWTTVCSWVPSVGWPKSEGVRSASGICQRNFGPEDIYLTSRLDGPKTSGTCDVIFAVRKMLHRAMLASSPDYGIDPSVAAALLDEAIEQDIGRIDRNRTFNIDRSVDYWIADPNCPSPPDSQNARVVYDYAESYYQATYKEPYQGMLNFAPATDAENITIILDSRSQQCITQSLLQLIGRFMQDRNASQALLFLATFGTNGDESRNCNYINSWISNLQLLNGAVFTSIESFNAATMFKDYDTRCASQGKIVDFIAAGGTAAVGHAFEPQSDAVVDNEFILYNLLADNDGDGRADMTFAEAVFSGIPYLSWAEVAIGDPLMRYIYKNNGSNTEWNQLKGDANNDGYVTYLDVLLIKNAIGSILDLNADLSYYNDLYDINHDFAITYADVVEAMNNIGSSVYEY